MSRASDPLGTHPRASLVLLTGLWMALVCGYVEVGTLLYRRLAGHGFIHRSRDFLWMTPTGYLLLFAVPVLVLWVLYRVTRLSFPVTVAAITFGGAGSLLWLLFDTRLHPAALLLFAAGLSLQVSRVVRRHPGGFARMIRGSVPWLAGLLLVLGLATAGWRYRAQRLAAEHLGAAPAGAPNVLLIILDTVRAASLGLYGYPRATTPELERWARRGVVFDRAVSTAPWTLPSHASIFTGRFPHSLSANWLTPLDDRWPTLAEAFRDDGYRTGGFVANLMYATWEHGLDRGFATYQDYPFSLGMLIRQTAPGRRLTDMRRLRLILGTDQLVGRKSAQRIGHDFLHWLDQDPGRPFFAFLNYFDAHEPYLPPQRYFRQFAGHDRPNDLSPFRRAGVFTRSRRVRPADVREEEAGYDGAIAYLDHELGRLFQELERRGMLDRTLVIVTADHGEEFGEHGFYYHGHTLYGQALHVPLLMLEPGVIPSGRRVPQTVSLRDLAATIADLSHLPAHFPGRSLRRYWTDSAAIGEAALSEVSKGIRIPAWYPGAKGDMVSVVVDGVHYIRGADGGEEIFDWNADPQERRDIAGDSAGRALAPGLRRAVQRLQASPEARGKELR